MIIPEVVVAEWLVVSLSDELWNVGKDVYRSIPRLNHFDHTQ